MARPLNHEPNEHHLKPLVRRMNVPLSKVAGRVGISEVYLSYVLSGRVQASAKLEAKLEDVVIRLYQSIMTSRDKRDERYKKDLENLMLERD